MCNCLPISLPPTPLPQFSLDGLGDCDPLTGSEVLANLVLIVLGFHQRLNTDGPGWDGLPFEDVSYGQQSSLTKDQQLVFVDPNGL